MLGQEDISKEEAQEITLKFKELRRTAERDLTALNSLEESLMSLQLEKARQTDPWELITTPTLLDQPVAPQKKIIVGFGLLGGFFFGCGTALILERRSGLIYNKDELKALLPYPLIVDLPYKSTKDFNDTADLLASSPLLDVSDNSTIALIPFGNISTNQVLQFSSELRRALNGRELIVSTDLCETGRCEKQLLLTSLGAVTRSQISQLCQKLIVQGKPLAGWMLIDADSN